MPFPFNIPSPEDKYDWEHESESFSTEADFAEWLSALKEYVKQTKSISLDLSYKNLFLPLDSEEAQAILKVVADSDITKLNLGGNRKQIDLEFLQSLTKTKVRELDLTGYSISKDCYVLLLKILKDTCIQRLLVPGNITGFYSNGRETFRDDEVGDLADSLSKCHLENLSIVRFFGQFKREATSDILRVFPLHLVKSMRIENDYEVHKNELLSRLSPTSIKNLCLSGIDVTIEDIHRINNILIAGSLESLKIHSFPYEDLSLNEDSLKILSEGLKYSNISHLEIVRSNLSDLSNLVDCMKLGKIKFLNVSENRLTAQSGWTSFTECLKDSSVEILMLQSCNLKDEQGEQLLNGLKGSKVTKLDGECNDFRSRTALAFSQVLKETNLTEVYFFGNRLPIHNLSILADGLVAAELKSLNISVFPMENENPDVGKCFSDFMENIRGSQLRSLRIHFKRMRPSDVEKFVGSLQNATLTHLDLSSILMGNATRNLSENLKLTTITHLNLSDVDLGDKGSEMLAKCLSDTEIVDLDLSANFISDRGAKALAPHLRGTKLISLNLCHNRIGRKGLKFLAEHVENTFITTLAVGQMAGIRFLTVDRVLLGNRVLAHKLVNFFKLIRPEGKAGTFDFDRGLIKDDTSGFLDECLNFYKTVTQQPSAISVLSQEDSLRFSKDELISIFLNDFPRQFVEFISSRVEADLAEHVEFLARADELGLSKVVEYLLLCRPTYTIDEENGILHPLVYRLLVKHKMPVCNLDVEPDGLTKIMKFFTEHSEIEGALETLKVLHGSS